MFYQYSETIAQRTTKSKTILLWILFAFWIYGANTLMDAISIKVGLATTVWEQGVLSVCRMYLKISLAWLGIWALYSTAVLYCRNHTISNFVLKVGVCGYGVYLFHQFILIYLYRLTSLPQILGTYWLPWMSLLITIVISVSLTLLVRKTSVGRKYI